MEAYFKSIFVRVFGRYDEALFFSCLAALGPQIKKYAEIARREKKLETPQPPLALFEYKSLGEHLIELFNRSKIEFTEEERKVFVYVAAHGDQTWSYTEFNTYMEVCFRHDPLSFKAIEKDILEQQKKGFLIASEDMSPGYVQMHVNRIKQADEMFKAVNKALLENPDFEFEERDKKDASLIFADAFSNLLASVGNDEISKKIRYKDWLYRRHLFSDRISIIGNKIASFCTLKDYSERVGPFLDSVKEEMEEYEAEVRQMAAVNELRKKENEARAERAKQIERERVAFEADVAALRVDSSKEIEWVVTGYQPRPKRMRTSSDDMIDL